MEILSYCYYSVIFLSYRTERHFLLDLVDRESFSFFTSQHVTKIYKKERNTPLRLHYLPYSNLCIFFFIFLDTEREGMREAWIFKKVCLFSSNLMNVTVPNIRNVLRGNICLHLKLHKKQYCFSLVITITLWVFRSCDSCDSSDSACPQKELNLQNYYLKPIWFNPSKKPNIIPSEFAIGPFQ